jgi:ferric-chelate reductase (NADPH)
MQRYNPLVNYQVISSSLRKLKVKLLGQQQVNISQTEKIGDHFILVTFCGEAIRTHTWHPGQKIQLVLSQESYLMRTYTPISWDNFSGHSKILVYLHGDAPGANWASRVQVGDHISMLPPRNSIDLLEIASPTLCIGDETSIGLAKALIDHVGMADGVHMIFEVSDINEARIALAHLDIHHARLIQKRPNNAHFSQIKQLIHDVMMQIAPKHYIFTGSAHSIQQLTQSLKRMVSGTAKFEIRAYWAEGKMGLD